MTESDVATIELSVSGRRIRLELEVPRGPTRPERMLPVFQSLANTLVAAAVESSEATGARISCTKGCGACCRQIVPVADIEARGIRAVVDAMPGPRKEEILARFAAARERLHASGLLRLLSDTGEISDDAIRPLALEYFALGLACPFLEDESCSIHAVRPTACREYLVTSPAEHCAKPDAESVSCVKMPGQLSKALRRVSKPDGSSHWVPLILAPEWADAHPDDSPARPGAELLRDVIGQLAGTAIPG